MTPPPEPRTAAGRLLVDTISEYQGEPDDGHWARRIRAIEAEAEAEAAGAPLREALERGCYFCGASGIAPHAGCPGGNVPQDMGLADALAIVFSDLDGTPGPVFGSYWQDRAKAVLAAWHVALTARQSEATTPAPIHNVPSEAARSVPVRASEEGGGLTLSDVHPSVDERGRRSIAGLAPAPLDVEAIREILLTLYGKVIALSLERENGRTLEPFESDARFFAAEYTRRAALTATPAPTPLDVVPVAVLDKAIRAHLEEWGEHQCGYDPCGKNITKHAARLTAPAAATEDTDDATK